MVEIPWDRDVSKDVEIMGFPFVYFHGPRPPRGDWKSVRQMLDSCAYSITAGFSSPGTSDIGGQIILCCRLLPCAWRMFISLSRLAASCTPSTLLIIKNISRHRQMSPEGVLNPSLLPPAIENCHGELWPALYHQSLLSMTASSRWCPEAWMPLHTGFYICL